jgi:hypothetical protein
VASKNRCENCRYWSQMCVRSIGCSPIEALCLSEDGPKRQKYTPGDYTCPAWKSDHHGQVDDPPDYGESVRALYDAEEL